MAMGRMPGARQEELCIAASVVRALDNPFYAALDKFLRESGFDAFAEGTYREFYAERMGRPGLPPGVYFRMLMVGYLEGIGSERGSRGGAGTRSRCGSFWATVWRRRRRSIRRCRRRASG